MPELPEVETIKNRLAPLLAERRFAGVDVFWSKAVRHPSPEEFSRCLVGQRIEGIRRRGKYFLFDLASGEIFILHLKMTGVLLLEPSLKGPRKHTAAIFQLDDESDLHFIDQRKFGSLWLVKDENEIIGKLGPEPFDKAFSPGLLRDIINRRSIPIKALLCDQHAIAGVGNMYADESLFAARIHPMKRANDLTIDEINGLHQAVIQVLERGILHNGASISTYCLPDGAQGMAQTQFKVAHRRNEMCLVCGTPITRISIRGRGTYFCPGCQPE